MPPNTVTAARRTNTVRQSQPSSPMAPAILASMRSILQTPTNQNVHNQTVALANALREAGVQDVTWVPYLMENMKKVASGENRAAVDWVKDNINSGNSLVPGWKSAALSLVNQAERQGFTADGTSRTMADIYGRANPQVGRDQVARFFDGRHSAKYRGQVVETLRNNGASSAAANTAGKLFDAYTQMRNSAGFNDKFYKLADEVKTLSAQAVKSGAINKKTANELVAETNVYLRKYPEAQREERMQAVQQAKQSVVDNGKALLSDLEYLDGKLNEQGGMHMAPWNPLPGQTAEIAQRKLPLLRNAVESGDPERIKRAMAEVNELVRPYGGARALGDRVVADNDAALYWMEKTADLASVIPVLGTTAKVLLVGSVEGLKTMSGKQTPAQALANTATEALNIKVGNLLAGSGPGKAILSSLYGSVTSFAKDAVGILSDGKGNTAARLEAAARKAVIAGFKAGIESQLKVLAGDAEARKVILDAAIKFGVDPYVKPMLEKFGEV